MTLVETTTTPLSTRLRDATRPQHEHAETRSFVTELMSGGLGENGREAYIALARQHHAIYRALEGAGDRLASSSVVAPFLLSELTREPSLAADLQVLAGPRWQELDVLPATHRYVERLEAIGEPATYIAHAYTRYLGDLSGGQIIGRMLQRHYGLEPSELTFYAFEQIPKPKPFKDHYRALLDAAALTEAEQEACAEEAKGAFDLNAALFVELGARFLPAQA